MLENYDENGNKKYGLIDAGQNVLQSFNLTGVNDGTQGKKDGFLARHGLIPTKELEKKEFEERNQWCDSLDFFVITHCHDDHVGTDAKKAISVLNNYKVKTLYIKEYDLSISNSVNLQKYYEDILTAAINNETKVIGVSPESLTNIVTVNGKDEILEGDYRISKSQSIEFRNFVLSKIDIIKNNFYGFDNNNIYFLFGSAKIKIINWEMFYNDGTKYKSGTKPIYETNGKQRLKTKGENSNSIGLLLIQGNKRAFFGGDLNNTDDGAGSPEDRVKYDIGEVDLLKLNHHGKVGSNSDSFLNVLNPKMAVVSNRTGEMDENTEKWLNSHNVNYLYTVLDSDCVTATIENEKVYLGFHDTDCFKKVNDEMYYISEGKQYADYTTDCYKISYDSNSYYSKEVNSFDELKSVIQHDKNINMLENNNQIKEDIDDKKFSVTARTFTINQLIIKLVASNNWVANENIKIEENQNIKIITDDEIVIKRDCNLTNSPIFEVNGCLDIGDSKMTGNITIDGNNVESSSTLLKIEYGILKLNNVTLCNNYNKTTSITDRTATMVNYSSLGSAIYSNFATIDINGGKIINNTQEIEYSLKLPKNITLHYYCDTAGSGIYLTNHSKLNMFGGIISGNKSINNSEVNTNETYSKSSSSNRTITQKTIGVGIYSNNSEINLIGGKIFNNTGINNAKNNLVTPADGNSTIIYSMNDGIYGVGIFVENSKLKISNNLEINSNNASLNSVITTGENTNVSQYFISAIRGLQSYIKNTKVDIDGLKINAQDSTALNNTTNVGTLNIDTSNDGGGITLKNCNNFIIRDLNISNCQMSNLNNGGALYIDSCSGKIIDNSSFCNNTIIGKGGAIYINSSDIDIKDAIFSNNSAKFGGAIYSNLSMTKLDNVKVCNNTSTGSGGGISSFGEKLVISGENTEIRNNTATTFGGGISINTSVVEFNNGIIKENSAGTYGYGIGVYSGFLVQQGGIIANGIGINDVKNKDKNSGKYIRYSGNFNSKVGKQDGTKIDSPDGKYYIVPEEVSNISKIEIIKNPNKIEYIQNLEQLDLTGGKLKITYKNGDIEEINLSDRILKISEFDNSKVGNQILVIEYIGKTTSLKVNVKSRMINGIFVSLHPSKTTYLVGENFDKEGMRIKAEYNDGNTNEVVGYIVTDGNNLSLDKTNVTISYTENGVTKTTTQSIIVEDKLQIDFNEYIEVEENEKKYVKNISPSTTVKDMINNINTNGTISVYKNNEIITNNNEKMSTSMKIKILLNSQSYEFIIAVNGDTNGDGESNLQDLLLINKHRLNKALLEDEFLFAGDVNKDNKVDLKDLLQVNKYRLGKIETL